MSSKPSEKRQVVRFAFYKLDSAWRRLSAERQASSKIEFGEMIESFAGRLLLRPYGLVGIRGDCDFLLWQVAENLDALVALQTALNRTDLGAYLTTPYSYLAMTRRSIYEFPEDPSQPSRLVIRPSEARYLFVYPFVKTRAWYMLRDTPTFACVQMSLWDMLDTLGGAGSAQATARRPTRADGYTPVATLADLPAGASRRVYVGGDAVALFNVRDTVYAIANRCTHARASLSEGTVDPARCTVTCPWHEGVFSLETGLVLGGPPSLPVVAYRVKLEGDTVLIAPPSPHPAPAEAREPTVAPHS